MGLRGKFLAKERTQKHRRKTNIFQRRGVFLFRIARNLAVLDELVVPEQLPQMEPTSSHSFGLDASDTTGLEIKEKKSCQLPIKSYPSRSKAGSCREILNGIRSLTFLVNDADVLEKLRSTLAEALTELQNSVPHENGLILESAPTKMPQKQGSTASKLPKLHIPDKRKNPYNKRRGLRADIMRSTFRVQVPVAGKCKTKKDDGDISSLFAGSLDVQECPERSSQEDPERSTQPTECATDEVIITGTGKSESNKYYQGKGMSTNVLEKIARQGEWLTDEPVNFTQTLLRKQFPYCEGLECTTLGPHLNYTVHGGEFVQVLHNGCDHWVCVSNIGCQKGEINYMDSLFFAKRIKPFLAKQIASLLHEDGPEIKINVLPVQQQQNGSDCGVLALAFATGVLHGGDPTSIFYDANKYRVHLADCLNRNLVAPFPQASEVHKYSRISPKTIRLELFCECRMPWNFTDKHNPDLSMAQCDACEEWFHRGCVKIPDEVFCKDTFWKCHKCTPKPISLDTKEL